MKRHQIIVAILVIAAAVPTSVFAQASDMPTDNPNPAVLEVNGEKVYAGEITMTMQNIAAQTGGQADSQNQETLVQMAMQRVVEQKLLAQEARRTGVKANEERLAEMTRVVVQQAGGREKLDSNLANFGMSYEQLTTSLLEMELTRSMIESQISPTIEVSDEEVTKFYEENPQFFDAAEQVHVRQIIFKIGLDAEPETATAIRAKAEDARRRALAGEDFAELARELSEGASGANGGDLGFLTREQMTAPQFANAAFATEPGGITPVVRTNFGFHVIKVEEMRPARHVPLDEVFDNVRNVLVQQKTGQAVGELVRALGEKATIVTLVTDQPAASQPVHPEPPQTAVPQERGVLLPGKGGTRKPAHYGLDIQFEDRGEDLELGRLVESTVWVNRAHPAYRRALISHSIGYHIALAVALALAPLAVESANEHGFVTAFLSRWGEALDQSRKRRKT